MLKDKNILSLAIVVASIMIAGAIVYPNLQSQKNSEGVVLLQEEATTLTMDFINNTMMQGQAIASFSKITEEYGLYKIEIIVEGQPFSSYLTKDGKFFFPEALNVEEIKALAATQPPVNINNQESQNPSETSYSGDINSLVSCLKEKKFVVYGADWCPYCAEVVKSFGGKEVIEPVYVECTVEETLCREKGVTGYPTILIDDKPYQGQRTLEGFAAATNCG